MKLTHLLAYVAITARVIYATPQGEDESDFPGIHSQIKNALSQKKEKLEDEILAQLQSLSIGQKQKRYVDESGIQDHYVRVQQGLLDTLVQKFKDVVDAVLEAIEEAVYEGMRSMFSSKNEQALIEAFRTIKQQDINPEFLARVQQGLVETIYNKIKEAVDAVIDKIKELAEQMVPKDEQVMIEAALNQPEIKTEFVRMQQGLVEKIYNKVKEAVDAIIDKTKELAERMTPKDEQAMIEAALNMDTSAARQQSYNSVRRGQLDQDQGVYNPNQSPPYRGSQYNPRLYPNQQQ